MKIKKVLSAISALAISVSAFAGMAVTANAAETKTVFSQSFTGDSSSPEDYGFALSYGTGSNPDIVSMIVTNGVLQVTSGNYTRGARTGLALASFEPIGAGNQVQVSYVWSLGNATGNASGSYTETYLADSNGQKILDIYFNGSDSNGKVTVNNNVIFSGNSAIRGTIYTVSATIDMNTKKITGLTLDNSNNAFDYSADSAIDFLSSEASTLAQFGFQNSERQSWDNTSHIDDINITAISTMHTVTVEYKADGEAIVDLPAETTTTYTVNDGSSFTPDYPKEFTTGDYKYTFVSSEPGLPVTVNSDTTITLNYEKTPVAPQELTAPATFAEGFTSPKDDGASVWTATLTLNGGTYNTIQATATDKDNNVKESESEEITTISGESTIIAYIAVNKAQSDLNSVTVTLK